MYIPRLPPRNYLMEANLVYCERSKNLISLTLYTNEESASRR